MGAPGSPYTRKMLAALRYRHIPYRVEWQTNISPAKTHRQPVRPAAKVALLPTFYLPGEDGQLVAVTDSTLLIARFESEYQGRAVLPDDPVLGFLNTLIEDYADEWLTKAMFHYRWHYRGDIDKAKSILPRWGNISATDEEIAPISEMVAKRQIGRLSYVGSNSVTRPVIEGSFHRFLDIFNRHLQASRFLFGARPASADFAIYGQLTCLALFDPTPQAIIASQYPRIYAWVETMEDLSGYRVQDEDWLVLEDLPDTLQELLGEIDRIYLPYLRANAAAVANGEKSGVEVVSTLLDGREWTQDPFTYQAKCLVWLREALADIPDDAHTRLTSWLGNNGGNNSGLLSQLA